MAVPSWYELVLLALAAWRTWRLVAEDKIMDGLRARILGAKGLTNARRVYVKEFIECPWCLGFWIALAWWGAWELWPHGTLVAAGVMALSALVGILGWAI